MKDNKVILWVVTIVLVAIFIYSLFFSSPTYKITFDTAGGNKISSVSVKRNEIVTKPEDPKKEGFTFMGWYVSGTEYNFNAPVTEDLTITAVWEEETTTTKKTTKKATKKVAKKTTKKSSKKSKK